MSSIATPIRSPPIRFAASVPSGSVGKIGLSRMPRPHRSQAPSAAPPPTATIPPQNMRVPPAALGAARKRRRGWMLPDELLDVRRAEAVLRVVAAAHVDLGPDVLVARLPAGFVDV